MFTPGSMGTPGLKCQSSTIWQGAGKPLLLRVFRKETVSSKWNPFFSSNIEKKSDEWHSQYVAANKEKRILFISPSHSYERITTIH